MKKRLRLTVVSLVVVLLGGIGFLVGRSLWQQWQTDLAQQGLEFLPGVSQHISDFRRVKMQDGRKVWEVAAQDAQYFDQEDLVVVRDAALRLFLKDGRVLGMKGEEGRIYLETREVTRVEFTGEIELTLADYTIRTTRATYDHGRGLISAPDAVEISSPALQLRGDRMEVEVATLRVSLLDHVSMHLQPDQLPRGGSNAPF